jgi:TonB family protein
MRQNLSAAHPALLLAGFALLSSLFHAALLTIPTDNPARTVEALQLAAPLQVVVVSNRDAESFSPQEDLATETETQHIVQESAAQQRTVRARSIAAKPPVFSTSRVAVAKQDLPSAPPASTSSRKADNVTADKRIYSSPQATPVNHLHAQLRDQLAEHFTYPRLARRMGWEGEVALGLHIEGDGSLNQIRVVHSSGYTVLDQNAQTTLRRIGRITVAANRYIDPVDTEIEVLYRLTD